MKCVFYNVENLFDTANDPKTRDDDFTECGSYEWDERKYFEKLDNIAEVLTLMNESHLPDLLGLVEVENYRVVKDLIDHRLLNHMPYKVIHAESRDQRGIDVCLVYNQHVFEPLNHGWINIDDHAPHKMWSRDILHVEGKIPSGETLHVFVCHWPSRRDGADETAYKRKSAAKALLARWDEIRLKDPSSLVLVMGDMNDTPSDKSISEILEAKKKTDASGELLNLSLPLHLEGKGTVYRDEWFMFDQLIVSHDLANRVVGGVMYIFEDDRILYYGKSNIPRPNRTFVGSRYTGGYSDHLPIWLELNVEAHD